MTTSATAFAFAFVTAVLACSGSSGSGLGAAPVGGPCTSDSQCASTCVRDGDFPGGMCSIECRGDADCPFGTACVDVEGGVCAVTCATAGDCVRFAAPYECRAKDRHGVEGQVLVCRKP